MLSVFFNVSISYLYIFFSKRSIQILCYFLNCLFIFLFLSYNYSLFKFFISYMIIKLYFPTMLLTFSFTDWCLLKCKHFKFWWNPFIMFFSLIHWAFGVVWRNTCRTQGNEEFLLSFILVLLIVLVLIFRFMIDFVLISIYSEVKV